MKFVRNKEDSVLYFASCGKKEGVLEVKQQMMDRINSGEIGEMKELQY